MSSPQGGAKTSSTVPSLSRSPFPPPEQEIRLAVVMYGGISLCIYIHGVAQELLRLVRATSGADVNGDEVVGIYREISQLVPNQSDPDRPCPTRFVIDILSGTSAGGINAVFLAKALALRSQSLDDLRQTWLDTADMKTILNRGGFTQPKRSLLNGDLMYQDLYAALRKMKPGRRDIVSDPAPGEKIDLFITTTDLNGVPIPIRLADMNIPEKVHKGCFNFRKDDFALVTRRNADPDDAGAKQLDTKLDGLRRNDFEKELDPMLAFAARCTSSFPIAFAPMKLANIKPVVGKSVYENLLEEYRRFFSWIPQPALIDVLCPVSLDGRELADGGYLDNKPFDYAIDALTFRATPLRYRRKLFFVDPFPEIVGDEEDQEHFDFLENTIAGSVTLPHYQTIRQEIARVKTSNRTQERLKRLQDRTMKNAPRDHYRTTSVDNLRNIYGTLYDTYHVVRLLDCTDDLARIVCGFPASALSEDTFLAVRYLARAWREATYKPNAQPFETRFFDEFDFGFRMRRAAHLLAKAQNRNDPSQLWTIQGLPELLVVHLTRLQRMRELLSIPDEKTNPSWSAILKLRDLVKPCDLKSILEPAEDKDRLEVAKGIRNRHPGEFQELADAIREAWAKVFDVNRRELEKFRKKSSSLEDEYQYSDYHDMVSLAFLEGSDVNEHTQTDIHRISPADGIQRRPVEKKLCGYRVRAFGAFLKREWRENDILWGRLDTCERIVSAVLAPKDRDKFVKRLQAAIIKQEARNSTLDLTGALDAIERNDLDDLQRYLAREDRYKLPDWPEPKQSARQMADAADIFGRMIEEDAGTKNKATGWLRSGGGLAAQLIGLLTPGGLGRVFWNYWLALFGVAAGLLWLFGSIFKDPHAKSLGEYGVGVAVLTWFLSWFIGSVLAGSKVSGFVINVVKFVTAIAFLALLWIGLVHVPQAVHDSWLSLGGPGLLLWSTATLRPILKVPGFAVAAAAVLVLVLIGLRHLPQDTRNLWRRLRGTGANRRVRS